MMLCNKIDQAELPFFLAAVEPDRWIAEENK